MPASIFEGYAKGVDVKQSRDDRRTLAEQRNQELQKQGYSFEKGEMSIREGSAAQAAELASKEAVMRSKALFGKMSKLETAGALEEFSLTGDAAYLNKDLNSSPEKKAAWMQKGVHTVDNINFDRDTNLLRSSGFNPEAYDTPEKQEIIRKSAYKIYNGKEWTIGLANSAAAETGASGVLGSRRMKPAKANHRNLVDLMAGPKSSPYAAEGHKYQSEIEKASQETGVPANILSAMMATESSNDPSAVSTVRGKDYTGLMQVGEDAAKEVGIEDRNASAEANVMAGARYFKKQLDKYGGDVRLALAAYNAGPGKVDKYGGIPPFSETQNYVKKITARLDKAESFYGNEANDIYDALLQYDREQSAAKVGKTAEQISRETEAGISAKVKETSVIDRKLAQEDRALDIQTGTMLNKAKELAQEVKKPTTKRKELNEAEQVEVDIYEQFGGYEEFMKSDLKVGSKKYTNVYSDMISMEKLTGMKPSDAQLKNMKSLRVMGTLFTDASSLTKDQTGIIDTSIKGIQKYLDENMTEGKASAAYNSIRNLYIHSLAGTAQSESEAKRIKEAFGDQSQKLGPVLTQLSGILTQKVAELDSVMRDMHPVSAKVRLGIDMEQMFRTKSNMDATLGYIEAQQKFLRGEGPDPDARPPLSSFETGE